MAGQTDTKDKAPAPTSTPSAPATSAPKSTGSKVKEGLRGQTFESQEAMLTPGGNTHGLGPTEVGGKGREGEVARNKNNGHKDRAGQIFDVAQGDADGVLAAFSEALRAYESNIVSYGEIRGAQVLGGLGMRGGSFEACFGFALGNHPVSDPRLDEFFRPLLPGSVDGAIHGWLTNMRLRPDVLVFPEFASWSASPIAPPTRSRALSMQDFMPAPDSVSHVVQGLLSRYRFRSPGLAQGMADRFAIWRSSLKPTFMGQGTVREYPAPGPVLGQVVTMPAFD